MTVTFQTSTQQKVATVWPTLHTLCEEGSLFVATNPTPGTGIATTTSITSETQTSPVLLMQNQWAPGAPTSKNLYPISLELIVTAAPTSATFWHYSIRLDAANPSKYTSGGSQITPVNTNAASGNTSSTAIYFGAITGLTQATGGRLIASGMLSPTIPLVKDTMRIEFGVASMPGLVNVASTNVNRSASVPAICIPPGYWLAVQMWGTSNAGAPAFEFNLQYAER